MAWSWSWIGWLCAALSAGLLGVVAVARTRTRTRTRTRRSEGEKPLMTMLKELMDSVEWVIDRQVALSVVASKWDPRRRALDGVALWPSGETYDARRDALGVRAQKGCFVAYAVVLTDVLSTYGYLHNSSFTPKVSVEIHVEFPGSGVVSDAESIPLRMLDSQQGNARPRSHKLAELSCALSSQPAVVSLAAQSSVFFSASSVKSGRTLSRLEFEAYSANGLALFHATHTKCVVPSAVMKLADWLPNRIVLGFLQAAARRAPQPAPDVWHFPGPQDVRSSSRKVNADKGDDAAVYEALLEPHWGNTYGSLHGGFICALLHAASTRFAREWSLSASCDCGHTRVVATQAIHTHFLSQVRLSRAEQLVYLNVRPVHHSPGLLVEASMYKDQRLIAKAFIRHQFLLASPTDSRKNLCLCHDDSREAGSKIQNVTLMGTRERAPGQQFQEAQT
mmetsp:Transcript_15624/g.42078  ORF Transcript_15624/g.42078 Transcript_15624/m.42078 type:complete len:449 (-) Transcript_15624:1391-2737(-)